jgi:hypothetical protein
MKNLSYFGMLATLLALAACDGTGGREVSFSFAVESIAEPGQAPGRFRTTDGWDVTLTKASVYVGPVYLYQNAGVGLAAGPSLLRALDELLVPRALAHAGDVHFNGGAVWGEYLGQVAFDPLGGPVALGELTGTAAAVRSVSLVLMPPRQALFPNADPPDAQALVEGVAEKGEARVAFAGQLAIPLEARVRNVDGIPVDFTLDEGGTFTLGVRPARWFERATFDDLAPTLPGEVVTLPPNGPTWNAWSNGLRSVNAWRGRWTPAGG